MSPVRGVLLLSVAVALSSAAGNSSRAVRPQITRTSLHVARSLDPADSELLTVRSKNGEVATLIVKRREGKSSASTERPRERGSLGREPKSGAVPEPVEIRSQVMYVKDEEGQRKKARNLDAVRMEDGVPVVEGVRVPDSPEDKLQTWRNAKVINGVLVPYKQALSGEIPLKGKPEVTSELDAGGEVKSEWKGVETEERRRPVSAAEEQSQAKLIEYIMKINQKEMQYRRKAGRSIGYLEGGLAGRRMDENVDENEEPLWVNSHPKEIWTEEGKISVAERRMDRMGEGMEGKFVPVAPVQGRLLQPQGVSSYPASPLYSRQPSRVSFEEGVRTPVLQYAHPELGAQPAKVEREGEEGEEGKGKGSVPSLRYFSNDPYADRSPYAYEPGLASEGEGEGGGSGGEVENSIGEREMGRRQSIRNIEFTTAGGINPEEIDITEAPSRVKGGGYFGEGYRESYGVGNDNYLQPYQHYGHPGKYSMTKEDYYKWKMSGMSYGGGHGGGYYVKIPDNRPLWEKITESIKETVQSGVESMKEMTRPVMEPLVEATQRISENLGIPGATAKISSSLGLKQGAGMRTGLQEKIGAAASSSPVLLPALGLVGAGAALGLGAVAVGRLLDVNVNLLKRSESGSEAEDAGLEMEHKRALEAVEGQREGKSLPAEGERPEKESRTELKRLIDESGIEGLERFHFDLNEHAEESKSRRRSLGAQDKAIQEENEAYLKRLEGGGGEVGELAGRLGTLGQPRAWKNLPCAQRAFCGALVKRKDSLGEVESLVKGRNQPAADEPAAQILERVFSSARSQDCSSFVCHRKVRR